MANYTVTTANGERAAHAKTLTANVVDKVTFDTDVEQVEVVSNGIAAVYIRVDGVDPVVAGAFSYLMPAGVVSTRVINVRRSANTELRLISSGAATYSVSLV